MKFDKMSLFCCLGSFNDVKKAFLSRSFSLCSSPGEKRFREYLALRMLNKLRFILFNRKIKQQKQLIQI